MQKYPDTSSIYRLISANDVELPAVLAESFETFIANSGMPFAPTVTRDGENAVIHFLFLTKDLRDLIEEFLATMEPDGFYTTEIAVANDRVKHTIRIADESGWIPFIRQSGAERTRICFIKKMNGISAEDLEERIDLVS
jgi:hypothetical protein